MESQEEVNGMLGVRKKSGIINCSLLSDGLNWDVFGSLSALIIFMVHIPFTNLISPNNFLYDTKSKIIYYCNVFVENMLIVLSSLS